MIRILVVDDYAAVRRGLVSLLKKIPQIEVVGEAADGLEAVEQARQLKPDVILMDISMPQKDGIAATRDIRDLGLAARIIIVSTYTGTALAEASLQAGAVGYIAKHELFDALPLALAAVMGGNFYLSPTASTPGHGNGR